MLDSNSERSQYRAVIFAFIVSPECSARSEMRVPILVFNAYYFFFLGAKLRICVHARGIQPLNAWYVQYRERERERQVHFHSNYCFPVPGGSDLQEKLDKNGKTDTKIWIELIVI